MTNLDRPRTLRVVLRTGRRVAAVLAVALMLCLLTVPSARAETVVFTWQDSRIPAPVGLARDTDHGVYWTATASPASTTALYAVAPDGKVKARVTLGAQARGPAAVAYDGGRVFIADSGSRGTVTVSYVTVNAVEDANLGYRAWDFSYGDSSQTTRALIIGPSTQLYLVTSSGAVYKAPSSPTAKGTNRLTKVASGPSGVVGGTADGDQVVLRTASELVFCDPTSFQVTSQTPVPAQNGARGVTRSLDGTQLLISGQGIGSSVLAVGGPGTPSPSPSPPASSSSSASPEAPSPAASSSAPASPEIRGETVTRSGTMVALGAALVLAVVVGVATFARR